MPVKLGAGVDQEFSETAVEIAVEQGDNWRLRDTTQPCFIADAVDSAREIKGPLRLAPVDGDPLGFKGALAITTEMFRNVADRFSCNGALHSSSVCWAGGLRPGRRCWKPAMVRDVLQVLQASGDGP
ncbi:uncharacterized protein LOC143349815 [Colletes latitarsis]|uniref:uncharacterized protein LOC143349815 n=1 Tax=Colletes latitarsis TaxID=2605962 RepID=UPI0040374702